MKYFVILGIIALIFYLLILWRMRRYFPLIRQIFGITRSLYRMRKGAAQGDAPLATPRQAEQDKLVRCAACGTWIPSGRALSLRGNASVYCSTTCLENAASQPQGSRRSAKG